MPEIKKGCDRSAKVDRSKIDTAKRTVELAFASEEPVERWGENEVLSHAKGDYDFSRIGAGTHPLLLGHAEYDPTSQIGVVESARVDPDKIARAVVRFGSSSLASEIFQDVQDGIRQLISVGYDRTSIVSSDKSSDGMVTTRYRWMPTHIAVVPVPADTRVGVGREKPVDSQETVDVESIAKNLTAEDKNRMRILLDPAPAPTAPAAGGGATPVATVDAAEVRSKAMTAERNRVKEISAAGDALIKDHGHCADKIRGIVNESIAGDVELGAFQIRAMKEVLGAKPAKPVTMLDLGMNEREANAYSILRGVQSCLLRRSNEPDGLEGEVHKAMIARKIGVQFEGFAVPADARVRCRPTSGRNRWERRAMQRDLQVDVFNQGGATVATQLITPIIEILRNRMVTQELGVQSMAGLEGMIAIPRQTGAATAYSLPESATLTKSTQALDQISLNPKRVGAWNDYTRQLLLQSSIDVENFIRDDLMKVIAINWDFLLLQGNGAASQPTGILNTPGIGSLIFGATPTWAQIVSFETQLNLANALTGRLAWVTSPSVKGRLKAVAKTGIGVTSVVPIFLWEDGEMNEYEAMDTNQIQNNLVFFGNWEEAIHALWGGYDVIVNPYSRDTDAAVRITINTFGDVAVRHPVSFCVSADAGNQ